MAILITIILGYISIKYYGKLCNPILVGNFVLSISMVMSIINGKMDDERLSTVLLWITIGMLIFSIAFLSSQELFNGKNYAYKNIQYNLEMVNKLATACCIIAVIYMLLAVYQVMQVAPSFESIFTQSTYVRTRYLARSVPKTITIFNVFINLNYYIMIVILPKAVVEKCSFARCKIVFVILLSLFTSIVTMSKDNFIVTCIIIFSAYMQALPDKKKEIQFIRKNAKWILLLFITLLIFIAIQRNYIGTRYNSYTEAVIGTISSYISIPIYSFGALIDNNNHQLFYGAQCFRPIVNVLSYFGLTNHVSIIQEAVDGYGNVYTAFGNMYNDFGFIGIPVLSLVIGIALGACYRKKSEKFSGFLVNSIIIMTVIFLYYDFKLSQTVYLFSMIYAGFFEKCIYKKLYMEIPDEKRNTQN